MTSLPGYDTWKLATPPEYDYPDLPLVQCPHCEGVGKFEYENPDYPEDSPTPTVFEPCDVCHGEQAIECPGCLDEHCMDHCPCKWCRYDG